MSAIKELQIKFDNIKILCNKNNSTGKNQYKVLTKKLPILSSSELQYLYINSKINIKRFDDKYSIVYFTL